MIGRVQAGALSLAYQMDLQHLSLRLGLGVSRPALTWTQESLELAWRFGGPSRAAERRALHTWRQNRGLARVD